jgi:Na+/proline symporter
MDTPDLMHLQGFDWLIIFLYGLFMFGIAFWAYPKVKDCGSFLVGSRKMGNLMIIASAFAGGTNANHPMAVAAATFQRGLSGVWLSLTWILITPFLWLYPPVVRRLRIVTTADIVRMRFGHGMATIFKLVVLCAVPMSLGFGLKSAAIVVEVMTGGAVSGNWALVVIVVPTILYTLLGGVIAAYATDIYQGLLIILLSFLLVPFAIVQAGGGAALNAAISDEMTYLIARNSVDFGFWWVFWFAIGITFAATIATAAGSAAAKNEMVSRMKAFGSVIKRFCTVGWGLVGLFAVALYVGHPMLDPASGLPNASPDNVFALAAGDLLPIGLRGLLVASILAAVMSSLDASLLTFSGMAVNNLYQEHFVRKASAAHYLFMARVFAVIAMLLGWYIAAGVDDLVDFATIVEPIYALTGMSILVALMWRRATATAAIVSVLVATPLFIAVNKPEMALFGHSLFQLMQLQGVAEWIAGLYSINLHDPLHGFVNAAGEVVRLPVQVRYPMFIVPSLTAMIGISFLTRQHNEHAVAEFYCRLDTPVGQERRIREAGFQVDQLELLDEHEPDIADDPTKNERLLLVDLLYLPGLLARGEVRLSQYKWDWIGLFGSIVFVVLFIGLIEWIGSLLR